MDVAWALAATAIILATILLGLGLSRAPLYIRVSLEWGGRTRHCSVSLTWLGVGVRGMLSPGVWGLFPVFAGMRVPFPLKGLILRMSRAGGPKTPGGGKGEGGFLPALSFAIAHGPGLLLLLQHFLRSLCIRHLRCRAVVGLSDPAGTGILYGYFWALKSLLVQFPSVSLVVTPDFTRERLEGEINAEVLVAHPLDLLVRGLLASRAGGVFSGAFRERGRFS
ncbi:MAG: DUF2953 domain-containing protein [Methanolinea sp.]|nr:DUF2953 domain-containing protein [Methanolinea sp.]